MTKLGAWFRELGVWDKVRQNMHIVHFNQGETLNSANGTLKYQIFALLFPIYWARSRVLWMPLALFPYSKGWVQFSSGYLFFNNRYCLFVCARIYLLYMISSVGHLILFNISNWCIKLPVVIFVCSSATFIDPGVNDTVVISPEIKISFIDSIKPCRRFSCGMVPNIFIARMTLRLSFRRSTGIW